MYTANKVYEETGKNKIITPASLKSENQFLKEVDSLALSNAQLNVKRSFTNFFQKRAKFPRFKSKKNNVKSYTTNCVNNSIRIEENIYSKNRKEKKMTDKETNFLKELDLLYQQDEEVSLDLMLELYENFEPFKIEAEKTGEGKEDEVRELYYKIGDRYFFLRVYSDEYDIDFDIMAKFELDLETVKSLNLLNYENF